MFAIKPNSITRYAQSGVRRACRLHLEPLERREMLSTCHVTRLSDAGAGTGFRGDLRYCITKVNTEPGADEIIIHRTGPINLNSALPDLASDIDIQGPGAALLTVRRNGPKYGLPYLRIFHALPGTTVKLSGMTISNGRIFGSLSSDALGAGILNQGTMTIFACVVSENSTITNYLSLGAGVHNSGDLTVVDSTITDNELGGFWARGGGISNVRTLSIYNSTIKGNAAGLAPDEGGYGGGVYNNGVMTILNSTIASNDTPWGLGGGIVLGGGFTVISHSIIANNGTRGIFLISNPLLFMRNTIVGKNQDGDECREDNPKSLSRSWLFRGNSLMALMEEAVYQKMVFLHKSHLLPGDQGWSQVSSAPSHESRPI